MIAFIDGTVDEMNTEAIVVEANGIGYLIYCADPYSFQKYLKQRTKVYTYQYVREDLIALYGFHSVGERALFVSLLGVSGIGPKGALAILATCTPAEVAAAVEGEDEKYLTQFPGIGKKTARQMILDLKGKLAFFDGDGAAVVKSGASDTVRGEAFEALRALGYADKEIQKVTREMPSGQLTTDEYIKKALQYIAQS